MDANRLDKGEAPEDISAAMRKLLAQMQGISLAVSELQRSNVELDRFASIAAHDLRSPLMSLMACLAAIHADSPAVERQQLLSQAHDSIVQMSRLITDLLTYAQFGTGELRRTSCDGNAVLARALASVQAMAAGIDARITHDHLPVVNADEILLVQLFQNLLENGLKYWKDSPSIHISCADSQNDWRFSVADHGIGIPADRLEDVFRPFTRLHGVEFPGTGLGLATCRRVIDRHKGRIWAESNPGEGTTFFFTLPK